MQGQAEIHQQIQKLQPCYVEHIYNPVENKIMKNL